MNNIRKLSEEDLEEYVKIVYNAYPGFGLDIEKLRGRMLKILRRYSKQFIWFMQGREITWWYEMPGSYHEIIIYKDSRRRSWSCGC